MLARDKRAISTSVSAVIVIALITIIGFGVYFNDALNTTSSNDNAPSSTSMSGSNQDITGNSGFYLLFFNQTAMCGPNTGLYGSYFIPWSVTLTGGSYHETTKAQPPGTTGTPNGFTSTKDDSYSSISFSVPNGTYSYTLNPANDFENSQTGASSGTIIVNGSNVTVSVHFNLASCGSTITTTTESTTTPNQSLIVLDLSNGSAACQSIRDGQEYVANWSGDVCTLTASYTVSSFALKPYVTLEIFPGVTVVMNGGGFANYGTIINNGTMEILTSFISYGVIENSGLISTNSSMSTESDDSSIPNGGTFENYGTFLISAHVGYYQQTKTYVNGTTTYTEYTSGEENLTGGDFGNGGVLDNYGTINNTGSFWNTLGSNVIINNFGTIRNLENAEFVNGYTINNNGMIINSGDFANNGRIVNYCGSNFEQVDNGTFSGNAVVGSCGTASVQTSMKEHSST